VHQSPKSNRAETYKRCSIVCASEAREMWLPIERAALSETKRSLMYASVALIGYAASWQPSRGVTSSGSSTAPRRDPFVREPPPQPPLPPLRYVTLSGNVGCCHWTLLHLKISPDALLWNPSCSKRSYLSDHLFIMSLNSCPGLQLSLIQSLKIAVPLPFG